MKSYFLMILLALVSLSGQAKKPKQLVILHTNDTHSAIFPINAQLPDTMKAGRGGFLRRIAMLKEERAKNPDLLYFDSGDFFQGSAYFTMFKGEVEVGLMNQMGIDALTIGNHEFDFGLENMAEMFKKATFPILCANYDFTGTVMEGLTKPWIVIKRNGVKIGVFAVCPKLEGLVSAKNCVGQKKCDVVICISHLGWESNRGEDDQYMIQNSRNIDLVLGGHTHTYMTQLEHWNNMDGQPVAVDQNGKSAIFVGKMVVELK